MVTAKYTGSNVKNYKDAGMRRRRRRACRRVAIWAKLFEVDAEPGQSRPSLLLRLWLLLRSFHHRFHILARRNVRHIWHVCDLATFGVRHDDSGMIQ